MNAASREVERRVAMTHLYKRFHRLGGRAEIAVPSRRPGLAGKEEAKDRPQCTCGTIKPLYIIPAPISLPAALVPINKYMSRCCQRITSSIVYADEIPQPSSH